MMVVRAATLPPIIGVRDLERLGLSRHRLYVMARSGELESIAPGYYVRPGGLDDTTSMLASVALRNRAATICLLSALSLHDLTDEIPAATDIALPRGARTLRTRFAPIRWHSFDRETFNLGRGDHQVVEGVTIGLYSAERTIVDVFRMRHQVGTDVANEALKRWLRHQGNSPSSLLAAARPFPKALPAIRATLEILL